MFDIPILTICIYGLSFLSLFIQIFLLVTYFERRKDIVFRSKPITLKRYPSVSIIVPCYNEERTLYKTIRSLLALEYPKDKLKLLLVDDGSIDGTWSIMRRFKKHPQIEIYRKENGGKHTAMNLGLEHTTSEFVGGLDADSFVHTEALKRIITYFDNPETMAVAPSILVYNPSNILQLAQKAEYDMSVYNKKMLGFLGGIHVTPGPFSIFRKKVFDDLGYYRKAHNTEDQEIALRMHVHGYKIDHCPDAYVYTVSPKTVRALYKQRLRWIYGFIKNTFDYKQLFFRKKYGHLAFFTLPAGAISIISVLAIFGLWITYVVRFIYERAEQWQVTGFPSALSFRNFDWFYVETGSIFIMSIVLYSLVIFALLMGRRIVYQKTKFSFSILYFFVVFSTIAPFWLMRAIWNAVWTKETKWILERKPGRAI